MFFYRKRSCVFSVFIFVFLLIVNIAGAVVEEKNNEKMIFYSSIKTLSADYKQTEYTNKGNVYASGKIIIKKPDKVLLEYANNNTNLKLVSINSNLKIIDNDIGQSTYIENQYNELLKFLMGKANNEKLYFNYMNELCLDFKHQDIMYIGCLDIDEKKKTINSMNLYAKSLLNDKTTRIAKVMSLQFNNLKINTDIEDDIFYIKDTRIFDDED